MSKIKSAIEIAMEKTDDVEELTSEEKEEIENQEKVKSLLAKFYKEEIDSNELWQELRNSKQSMLKEAQLSLIDSLRPRMTDAGLQRRKEGILAIESLKRKQNISFIEEVLNSIKVLKNNFDEQREQITNRLREEIERNPKLRMQPVQTPDGKTVMRMTMSADEAVEKRLADTLSNYEEQYNQKFAKLVEELKKGLKIA